MICFSQVLFKQAAARFTIPSRSLETPFGVLPALYNFLAFNNLMYIVNGAIDNKSVKRNRIGKILVKTMLLNQLRVTAPIESLHNLIETLKSDRLE